jgi:hypothetical protein
MWIFAILMGLSEYNKRSRRERKPIPPGKIYNGTLIAGPDAPPELLGWR